MSRRVKIALNKLIDEAVHKDGHPEDPATIILDECLHACVEGGFKPEKFLRYTLIPIITKPKRRQKKRERRRKKDY